MLVRKIVLPIALVAAVAVLSTGCIPTEPPALPGIQVENTTGSVPGDLTAASGGTTPNGSQWSCGREVGVGYTCSLWLSRADTLIAISAGTVLVSMVKFMMELAQFLPDPIRFIVAVLTGIAGLWTGTMGLWLALGYCTKLQATYGAGFFAVYGFPYKPCVA